MVYKVSSLHPLSLPTPFPGASSALFQCICKLCTHSLALWIILHKWHLTILIVLQLAFSTAVVNYVSRNEKRRAPHPQFQWSVSAPLRPRPLSLDRRLVPRPLPWPAPLPRQPAQARALRSGATTQAALRARLPDKRDRWCFQPSLGHVPRARWEVGGKHHASGD